MKHLKTKKEIRAELDAQIQAYISEGGSVNHVPNGISGNDQNVNLFSRSTQFEPKQERTLLNDIVKNIEGRKKIKKKTIVPRRRPKKKLITDDFGEPIRWVWSDQE